MPNSKILYLILNWNDAANTIACVESIFATSENYRRAVIIDNGSDDGELAKLFQFLRNFDRRGSLHQLSIIENGINRGFAGGANVGFRHALDKGYNFAMIVNNDTVVGHGALQAIERVIDLHPNYLAYSPIIRYESGELWSAGGRINWFCKVLQNRSPFPSDLVADVSEVEFVSGCALIVNLTYGQLFDEGYFFGEEDVEFSLRNRKNGLKNCIILPATFYHKVSTSINKVSENKVDRTIYFIICRMRTISTHYFGVRKAALLSVSLIYLFGRVFSYDGFFAGVSAVSRAFRLHRYHKDITRDVFLKILKKT
jgi:GT2 family glycosyltransferase